MSLERRDPVHPDLSEPDASGAPKSAAWYAADGAFAQQQRVPRPSAAVVTIRQSRVAVQTPGPIAVEDRFAQARSSDEKSPRVFQIGAAPTRIHQGSPNQPSRQETEDRVARLGLPPLRRKRISVDKSPGPVLRILPLQGEPDAEIDGIAKAACMSINEVDSLLEMLAQVDAVFDEIRRAQSFRFVDE